MTLEVSRNLAMGGTKRNPWYMTLQTRSSPEMGAGILSLAFQGSTLLESRTQGSTSFHPGLRSCIPFGDFFIVQNAILDNYEFYCRSQIVWIAMFRELYFRKIALWQTALFSCPLSPWPSFSQFWEKGEFKIIIALEYITISPLRLLLPLKLGENQDEEGLTVTQLIWGLLMKWKV